MKKNILHFILAASMTLTVLSCSDSWLDRSPADALSREEAIGNLADAFSALNGVYDAIQGASARNTYYAARFIYHGDVSGDHMQAREAGMRSGPTYMMQFNEGNAPVIWAVPYVVINRANSFLFALEAGSTNSDPAATPLLVNDMMGQALMARALAHFDLLRVMAQPYSMAGGSGLGVPLIITPQDPANPPTRATIGEVYAQVIADLTEAYGLMVESRTNMPPYRNNLKGYFNHWSAKALLARVYLYMGNMNAAYTYATDVIANSGLSLAPLTLSANGLIDHWGTQITPEVLFEIVNHDTSDWGDRESIGYLLNEDGYEDLVATRTFIDLLQTYYADDKRRGAMIGSVKNTVRPWNIRNAENVIVEHLPVYVNKFPGRPDIRVNNIPILRLSEMYLIAAEAALTATNVTAGKGSGYFLTAIVQRGNPAAAAIADANATLDRILQERAVEFIGEGHRFFDLMRTGRKVVRYTNPDPATGDMGWHLPLNADADTNGNNARVFDWRWFRAILPIPSAEINANPNIASQQNPGY